MQRRRRRRRRRHGRSGQHRPRRVDPIEPPGTRRGPPTGLRPPLRRFDVRYCRRAVVESAVTVEANGSAAAAANGAAARRDKCSKIQM